jgi:hypothetical protein
MFGLLMAFRATGPQPDMDLPFIEHDAIWHIGELTLPPEARVAPKNWDYEFGLLSVSLDPEAWRSGWAGAAAEVFELRAPDRPLKFLDADLTLLHCRADLVSAALDAVL